MLKSVFTVAGEKQFQHFANIGPGFVHILSLPDRTRKIGDRCHNPAVFDGFIVYGTPVAPPTGTHLTPLNQDFRSKSSRRCMRTWQRRLQLAGKR